jgi:transmembrane sensor
MTSEEYILLYEKFIAGTITQEEERLLFTYSDKFRLEDDRQLLLQNEEDIKNRVYHKIISKTAEKQFHIKKLNAWWLAAAVLFMAVTAGLFFFNPDHTEPKQNTADQVAGLSKNNKENNAAVLTLADGSVIKLDQANNGVLSASGKVLIKKLKNSELVYDQSGVEGNGAETANNVLNIPRGRQYQITLADGTKVWLNSASRLSYPTNFKGTERIVELIGEAYFEVAKNKKIPFKVKVNGAEIQVLGTHFNVNAYHGSPVKTTLLEGSVRLFNHQSKMLLKPGQEGTVDENTSEILIKEVDARMAVAWKNGYFVFQDENIIDIMNQVSRWYDIEVEYQGDVTNKTFGGTYAKTKTISELLKGLELTGLVRFKVEGRRVIVM